MRCEKQYERVMKTNYRVRPGEPTDDELDAAMGRYLEEHKAPAEPLHRTTIRDPWEQGLNTQRRVGRRYTDSGTEGFGN